MDVGSQLLLSLCEGKKSKEFMRYQLLPEMFYGSEAAVFKFIFDHIQKYHKLPQVDTLRVKFPNLGKAGEPPKFYLDHVEKRFAHKQINTTLLEANGLMKEMDTWEALEMMEKTVRSLRRRAIVQDVVDFGPSKIVLEEIARIKTLNEDAGIMLGWPSWDKMSGGLQGGDIISIVGRMAQGKTWLLVYVALYIWATQKKNVLFVTMEMRLIEIAQRVIALMSKVSEKHIRTAELTTFETSQILEAHKKGKKAPAKLWIYDGKMKATVDDIFTVVQEEEPDIVIVDGAYLTRHPDKRMNKYQRIDANVELFKERATDADIPAVLSYQFNRDAVKDKNKKLGALTTTAGLENIAHSDAIPQISSGVMALQQQDSVETVYQRMVDVLKCRTEKPSRFNVNWDFYKMDFSELVPEKASEMKFV